MFANRYTAFIDACTLARVLPRNLLLSLAEADFFRVRWSGQVLDETERAISGMLHKRGNTIEEAQEKAEHQIQQMRAAFEDAEVVDFEHLLPVASDLPDANDAHVLAAALKTQAAAIVTRIFRPTSSIASISKRDPPMTSLQTQLRSIQVAPSQP